MAHPNNSANATRLIGHIILFAGHQPDHKPQSRECQEKRTSEADCQAKSRNRKVSHQSHGCHWRPPEVVVASVSELSWPNTLARSALTSVTSSTESPTCTSSNNSSTS